MKLRLVNFVGLSARYAQSEQKGILFVYAEPAFFQRGAYYGFGCFAVEMDDSAAFFAFEVQMRRAFGAAYILVKESAAVCVCESPDHSFCGKPVDIPVYGALAYAAAAAAAERRGQFLNGKLLVSVLFKIC
jgi:hypothetical protein